MKTARSAFVAVAAVLGASTAAWAEPAGPYVQANVGAVLGGDLRADGHDVVLGPVALTESLRQGWMASLLIGHRLAATPVYAEAEGLYLNDAIRSDDINAALGTSVGLRTQTYAGLVNLKLEPSPAVQLAGLRLAPYAAGGVGYGHNSLSILGAPYTGDGLVWQVKAGLAVQANDRIAWDVGYRYLRLPTFDTNQLGLVARLKTDAHVISVGMRYTFGAQ